MANKRMFSREIIITDDFLEMPLSSQALYFHLCMNADDDGFVSPKFIMRLTGANEDDLRILIAKKFAIPFKNKVIVITHWLRHNTLKNDRYIPTEYQELKKKLSISAGKIYEICQISQSGTNSDGNILEPSIDKIRLDKNSIGNRKKLIELGINKYLEEKN